MHLEHSLISAVVHPGMRVRVVEDSRRPEFVGMLGTVKRSFGNPEYPALDVQLDNGRLELFWFHQLNTAS